MTEHNHPADSQTPALPCATPCRILLVSEVFPPEIGGAGAVALALATALPANVRVAAPLPPKSTPSRDDHYPFPLHRTPNFSTLLRRGPPGKLRGLLQLTINIFWTRPRALRALRQILAQHPADVLCLMTLPPCHWIPAALRRDHPALKTVFYLHGEEVNNGPHLTRSDREAQASLRDADAVLAVSRYTRDRAPSCGARPDRLTLLHNGVDTARFTPGPRDETLAQRLGLGTRQVLLCLARLDERKGQDRLLAAMPSILRERPNTVLLLVGGGADEARLRALTASLSLGPHVIFAGTATDDEVLLYYRLADLYIMPNRTTAIGDTEGFGLVFLEAGACAKPVIGGNAGGVPDAILDGKTGLLVDGNSPDAIAAAVLRLLRDPALARQLGEAGLAHSRANSWPRQAQTFLTLCENLCRQQGSAFQPPV